MTGPSDAHEMVKAAALGLADAESKRMFGADAFFVESRMFAFLLDETVVLKLPEQERRRLLASKVGRPFLVDERAPFGRWVEVGLRSCEAGQLYSLLQSAHALALVPDRDGPRRRRAGAPRRKRTKLPSE